MKCEFNCCLCNETCKCLLHDIEINSLGQCEECIVVSLPEEKLMESKSKQLQDIMNRHGDKK